MHSKGGHETRGAGEGRTKQWGAETLGDLWKGEGWGGECEELNIIWEKHPLS